MGAAVGAALKKIAVAILSDPKNWKKIIGLVLGLIVLVFTPIAVVLVMFQSLAEDTEHIAVSPEVESYTSLIEKHAEQHGIPEYTALIKAIMMQESNGQGLDPMQASECGFNTRYPHAPNSITDPEYSIDVGIQNIASVMEIAGVTSPKDLEKIRLALQGYNYGPGYISWAVSHYGGYSADNAAEFSDMMAAQYGWSGYGDKQYVPHVLRYYPIGRAFSSGGVRIDTGKLMPLVLENMSEESKAKLEAVEATMNEIEARIMEKGLDYSRVKEAQVLYILALSDISDQPGFVDTLVSCFWENQSDKQLIDAINSTFGKNIRASDFTKIMEGIRANYIYIPEFTNPGNKNNVDLVIWAKTALNERWGYVWGTFGQVLTSGLLAAKVEQYPDAVGGYYDFIVANWLGNRTADCIGLIKGYSWLDDVTHETVYGSNGMPDIGADQMYEAAIEKGPISTIPEIPGLAVWKPGHIGIYIGNGQVIEAAGTRIGVIQSSLYNGTFTHWLKIPYINYIEENDEEIPDDDAVIIEDETEVWQ